MNQKLKVCFVAGCLFGMTCISIKQNCNIFKKHMKSESTECSVFERHPEYSASKNRVIGYTNTGEKRIWE